MLYIYILMKKYKKRKYKSRKYKSKKKKKKTLRIYKGESVHSEDEKMFIKNVMGKDTIINKSQMDFADKNEKNSNFIKEYKYIKNFFNIDFCGKKKYENQFSKNLKTWFKKNSRKKMNNFKKMNKIESCKILNYLSKNWQGGGSRKKQKSKKHKTVLAEKKRALF